MKFIMAALLGAFLTTTAFANAIDLSTFKKIDSDKYPDIFDAIIIANNHSAQFGNCNLSYLNNPRLTYFANNEGRNPLFLAIPDEDVAMEGLSITTNSEMTQIISVNVVRFMKVNSGTIINPKIKVALMPTMSCK